MPELTNETEFTNTSELTLEYPVHLGLAYLFLVGYLSRTLFVCLRLPASVGVIVSGYVFANFFQRDLFIGRSTFEELAFFVVLLAAGLDFTAQDLQPYIFLLAFLPWVFEVCGIAIFSMVFRDLSLREAFVLGTILSAVGPGLVIPKMKELGSHFHRHPLPRMVFLAAPLEGLMALIFFGFLVGVSAPSEPNHPVNIGVLILVNTLRVIATLVAGSALGFASGWLVPKRMLVEFCGTPLFTGFDVEAFLIVLAVALIAYALGQGEAGHEFVPMLLAPGSLFQSELSVLVMATTFALVADTDILKNVESIIGGVWVFAQLILFSLLGSEMRASSLLEIHVVSFIGVGLFSRAVGILVALLSTRRARGCQSQSCKALLKDASFILLAALPRATLQAALGPVTGRLFTDSPDRSHGARELIMTAAKLYMCCMSVVGQTMLNTFGPMLLRETAARPGQEHCKGHFVNSPSSAGAESDTSSPMAGSEVDVAEAIGLLADQHGADPVEFSRLLDHIDGEDCVNGGSVRVTTVDSSQSPKEAAFFRKNRDDLCLSQFDAIGHLYEHSGHWRPGSPSRSRSKGKGGRLNLTRHNSI